MKTVIFLKTMTLALGVLILSSCNKKDLDALKDDVNSQNNTVGNLNNIVVNDDGIHGVIQGNRAVDSVGFTINYAHTYVTSYGGGAKVAASSTNYIRDNGDGTYDIRIRRSNNVAQDEYSEIRVTDYNPTVGISSADIYTFTYHTQQADDIKKTLEFWQDGNYGCCGNQITVDEFSLNLATRSVDISLTIESTEDDGYSSTENPTHVTMNFSGQLTWYDSTNNY